MRLVGPCPLFWADESVRVGADPRQSCLATRSLRGATVTRHSASCGWLKLYISFLPYFHLSFPPGLFFPFSRVELCFYPLSFSLPSFLHTGCRSQHPLEQRSSSFISLPLSTPVSDIKQTWGTSFGTSTPVLWLSLRAFVSPLFSLPLLRYYRLTRLTALLSRSHIFLRIFTDTFWAGFWGLIWRKFFWDFVGGTLRDPGGLQ